MRLMTKQRTLAAALLVMAGAMPSALAQGAGQGSVQGSGQAQASVRSRSLTVREASYLGIGVEDLDAERAKTLKLKEDHGASVTSVMPNTPASKAGLQPGDVILEFNGRHADDKDSLIQMVRDTAAGKTVKIVVWRNGALLNLWATIETHKVMESEDGGLSVNMPNMPPLPASINIPAIDLPRMITVMQNSTLGIEGESLAQEPQLAEFFGVKDGVLVKAVSRNSAAERAGMKAGDVLVKIGDTHIAAWRDVAGAMRWAQPGRQLNVMVVRNKKEIPLSLTIEDGR